MAIKVDLITGFLGSGKTTFLRKYVSYLKGQGLNVCILENDYGAVNVDMMLLSDLVDDKCDIEMVAGGCDYDCHKRRFKSKLISMGMLGYDRVVIEPSGIFDVDEFFDTLHEEPIDKWYECGSVITIADSVLLGEKDSFDKLSDDSKYVLATEAADCGVLVLSKIQNAGENAVLNTLKTIDKALELVQCKRRFLNSLDSSAEKIKLQKEDLRQNGIISKDWTEFSDDDFSIIMSAGAKYFDFEKRQIMDSNGYKSLYFMNKDFSIYEVQEKAKAIFSDKECGKVIRIKGFVNEASDYGLETPGTDCGDGNLSQGSGTTWYEINATKNDVTVEKIPAGQKVIIVIGEELNREKISSYYGTPADVHADATL